MEKLDDFLSKTNAIGHICSVTGFGRPIVERTLKQMEEEGRIRLISPSFTRAILISKSDVELVIDRLKNSQ